MSRSWKSSVMASNSSTETLRRIEGALERLAQQLRVDAREAAKQDIARAREDGELATDVSHTKQAIAELRKRFEDHLREHHFASISETGSGAPREEVALAKRDALRAEAVERTARTQMWRKVAIVLGAGGLGALARSLFG